MRIPRILGRACIAAMLLSCSEPNDPASPFTIGPAGGTVEFLGGSLKLVIPPGALGEERTFSAVLNTTATAPTLVSGTAFDVSPSGTFAQPVTMTISYSGQTLPSGVQESQLAIYRLANGAWESTGTSTVNTSSKTVSVNVTSLSTYAILGPPPNQEPSGFSLISDRAWNKLGVCQGARDEGWDEVEGCPTVNQGNLTIITDNTAPASGPNVAQMRYPQGFLGGSSPALAQRVWSSSLGYTQLYIRYFIKVSSNFEGHPTSTNKIFHYWIGNPAGNRVFDRLVGTGQGALEFQMALQGVPDSRSRLIANQGISAAFQRNRWYKIEALLVANTPGQANGIVRVWVDNQKLIDYTDVFIMNAGENPSWSQVQWSPTWGGGGSNTSVQFDMWLDHTYISAKP